MIFHPFDWRDEDELDDDPPEDLDALLLDEDREPSDEELAEEMGVDLPEE